MANEITELLDAEGVEYELLPHRHTESALAEAQALGVDPADVGKTLLVITPDGYMRVVLPAPERLDVGKLAEFLAVGRKSVALASEDALGRDYSEFPLGAVPPFGGGRRDPVVLDRRLEERESVVLEAGSHDESIRIRRDDLVRLTGARVADVVQD